MTLSTFVCGKKIQRKESGVGRVGEGGEEIKKKGRARPQSTIL